jgi:NAD-dependent protein deacetylase/lipoamidase
MSAESGIPTFRSGADAMWRNHRFEDLATPEAFARDPALVWAWYGSRIATLDAAQPNAGHVALASLESRVPRMTIITQNVDGLHTLAGSTEVVELHGNIRRARCTRCALMVDSAEALTREGQRCACGSLLRPDVVWFGEMLPDGALARAQAVAGSADVFIVAGTSAVVYPAAGLISLVKAAGGFLVEVNPEATPASDACDVCVRAKCGEFLPIVAQLLASQQS